MKRLWLVGLLTLGLAGCIQLGTIQMEAICLIELTNTNVTPLDGVSITKSEDGDQTEEVPTESATSPKNSESSSNGASEARLLPGFELFQFNEGETSWYTVDDRIMGGISRSDVAIVADNAVGNDPNYLLFYGTMSLENNDGFSSVRSNWNPHL